MTDSIDAATCIALPNATSCIGGKAERELSDREEEARGDGVTKAEEASIEARAKTTAKTVDLSNFIVRYFSNSKIYDDKLAFVSFG